MSFAPSTFHPGTGEDFFRKEGFLVDGMAPLITGRYTWPAFDDYDGTQMTITNSVARAGAGETASWSGWDLSSSITKGLILAYGHVGTAAYWSQYGVGFHNSTLPASGLTSGYYSELFPFLSRTYLYKADTSNISLGADTTIWSANAVTAPIWGIALYVDQTGGSEVQTCFVKSGTAEWLEVISATGDSTFANFQSCFVRTQGSYCRMITPIMVWGS